VHPSLVPIQPVSSQPSQVEVLMLAALLHAEELASLHSLPVTM
jgi:hypothetical protein